MLDRTSNLERLRKFISVSENGCWIWTGARDRLGYGWATLTMPDFKGHQRSRHLAHRAIFYLVRGQIPPGLCLDHLCRNPSCVNPDHLEPVTHRENVLRGISFAAVNSRKQACIHGHAFDPANTYRFGERRRQCRKCNANAVGRYKRRRAAPVNAERRAS